MFKIGDYVVNAKNGVCYIEDVQEISISGENKDYYLLIPQNERERESVYKNILKTCDPKSRIKYQKAS